MTKNELVAVVAEKSGATKKNTAEFYDALCEAVYEALQNDDTVRFAGVGTLKTVEVAAKAGRNPQTGASITIPAHKKVKFVTSSDIKAAVK